MNATEATYGFSFCNAVHYAFTAVANFASFEVHVSDGFAGYLWEYIRKFGRICGWGECECR